ncbi:MAG: TolC family protein [Planctomycetes bacterium]|nr:TolC family protein [Planctomycetota bacterium]
MIRSAHLACASLLVLSACNGPEHAQDHLYTELSRDLGGVERDDDDALAAGRRLSEQAAALDSGVGGLTLSDCFRLALENSESLRVQGELLWSSELQRRRAIATVLPQVALYGLHTRDSDKIAFSGGGSFQPRERTNYGFTVTQTLFDGKLAPRLSLIDETQQIQALELRDQRDRLLFAVASNFYDALGLEADVRAIEATRTSSRETLRVLEARQDLGVARADEVLLARASEAESEARLIQTQAELERVRLRLESILQRAPLPPLVDTFEVTSGPRELPRLVDLALRQRYDLEAARHQILAAEAQKDEAFTDYFPKAELVFNHLTESEEGFNSQLDWTLGISLEWTLFDGFGREARLAQTYSAIRQRELELRALEKQARLEVAEAALAFRSLDRALFAFEARANAAASAYDATNARLEAGSATHLELLVARDTREDAARNLTRTALGRKLAALRIRLAAGDLRNAAPVAALGADPR